MNIGKTLFCQNHSLAFLQGLRSNNNSRLLVGFLLVCLIFEKIAGFFLIIEIRHIIVLNKKIKKYIYSDEVLKLYLKSSSFWGPAEMQRNYFYKNEIMK